MSYFTVLTQVAILFGMTVVGFVVGKVGMFSQKVTKDLSSLLLYVATPALILNSMFREYDGTLIIDALIILGISLAVFGIAMFVNKFLVKVFRVGKGRRGLWITATSFTNPGFMGFPMALAVFGSDGLFLAAFVNLAQNIFLYSWGIREVQKDSSEVAVREPLWRVLISPINVSLVIGLLIFFVQVPIPAPVETIVSSIAGLVTPISMMLVGITISGHAIKNVFTDKDAFSSALVHLILIPLALVFALKVIPFRDGSLVPGVCVLMMAMPVPAMTQALATNYHSDEEFASHVVFLADLLCLATCPVIMMLV